MRFSFKRKNKSENKKVSTAQADVKAIMTTNAMERVYHSSVYHYRSERKRKKKAILPLDLFEEDLVFVIDNYGERMPERERLLKSEQTRLQMVADLIKMVRSENQKWSVVEVSQAVLSLSDTDEQLNLNKLSIHTTNLFYNHFRIALSSLGLLEDNSILTLKERVQRGLKE